MKSGGLESVADLGELLQFGWALSVVWLCATRIKGSPRKCPKKSPKTTRITKLLTVIEPPVHTLVWVSKHFYWLNCCENLLVYRKIKFLIFKNCIKNGWNHHNIFYQNYNTKKKTIKTIYRKKYQKKINYFLKQTIVVKNSNKIKRMQKVTKRSRMVETVRKYIFNLKLKKKIRLKHKLTNNSMFYILDICKNTVWNGEKYFKCSLYMSVEY